MTNINNNYNYSSKQSDNYYNSQKEDDDKKQTKFKFIKINKNNYYNSQKDDDDDDDYKKKSENFDKKLSISEALELLSKQRIWPKKQINIQSRIRSALWIRHKIIDGTITIVKSHALHRDYNLCRYCILYAKHNNDNSNNNNNNSNNDNISTKFTPHYFCHKCLKDFKFNSPSSVFRHLTNGDHAKESKSNMYVI